MRIVYLLNSLGVGGAERQALGIAERMAGCGHEVAILTLRNRVPEEWKTYLAVHRLNMRRSAPSFAAGLLPARRFLCGFRPDLIHSHSFHANIFARLLKVLYPRAAVVSTIHTEWERGWGRMSACRMTDALACKTAFVSQAAADRFVRLGVVPIRKCAVIPNGIDAAGFTPDTSRREAVRARMEAKSAFVWLAAGRIVPAKDYPNLLRAFAILQRSRSEARLWIAGEPVGAEGAGVAALAEELGLGRAVRFLGLRRDLPELLDAADGFVMSSAWEGMPLALAEAMAMEKNVVAIDVGGVRELVGECGLMVAPRDAAALAAAMARVMEEPIGVRVSQGRAARRRMVEKFDIEQRVSEWKALYDEALGKKK
jgi:glycosyltransferase involved in cell wall biosynthesis